MHKKYFKYNYQDIVEYLEQRGQPYILLTTEEQFIKEIDLQNLTPLYVKLKFRCVRCGKEMEKSLASIKASETVGICKSCSSKHPIRSYEEVIKIITDKGYTPLFTKEEYEGVKMKVHCIASCGHEVYSSIDGLLRNGGKCRKCCNAGESNYNWKGGYDSEKIKFRKTFEFKQFVKNVLKRDNYTCQKCGKTDTRLVVHHKDGYNWCIEKRTIPSNGVALCEECHKEFHHLYGTGNNTEEQYLEWINNVSLG